MDSPRFPFPAAPAKRGDAPRRVAHLAFAEILVIWALRRFRTCRLPQEGRAAVIAPELSRALGLARLEEALDAIAALAASLGAAARLPQALSRIEDDRINPTEEALLAVLAALQQGAERQATALCEWCLLPAGRAQFLAAARCLARSLREAGHPLPYTAPRQRHLVLGATPEDSQLPAAAALADLQAAEREVVTALRLWVEAFTRQNDPLHAARDHFARCFNSGGEGALWGDRRPGGDAGLSLHAVLRNTTLAATRPVDVRCPTCPGLSADEARLLSTTAWLQRDVTPAAEAALGDWLPPAALRLSLAPARGLAQALLVMERRLPLRDWDFTALAAQAAAPPAEAEAVEVEETGDPHELPVRLGVPTLH